MTNVRHLTTSDLADVVSRVEGVLADDAARNPMVDPTFDAAVLARALEDASAQTWVARRGEAVVGHLHGAVLESDLFGRSVWIGPDGASADDPDTLADLYEVAGQAWIDDGALEHYVWVLDDPVRTAAWYDLGFARMHQRGVTRLDRPRDDALPPGYRVRPGTIADLEIALSLSEEITRIQERGPSFSIGLDVSHERADWEETLSDPEVRHLIVEYLGEPVGQCATYPLPTRRGSFPATVHVSGVSVREEHRGRGVATALVNGALESARAEGFTHGETNWRVTNRLAAHHWVHAGFVPTYVRLHRTIGPR